MCTIVWVSGAEVRSVWLNGHGSKVEDRREGGIDWLKKLLIGKLSVPALTSQSPSFPY